MTTADAPLLMRLLAKVLLDILPAVIASVVGGLLFTHYQLGGLGVPAAAALSAPANAEMMQLLRDEHTVIVDYLKAQLAAEKSRAAEQDREMRAAAAEAAEPAPPAVTMVPPLPAPSPRREVAVAMAKAAQPHNSAPAIVPHAPLVIAQAEPDGAAAARLASDPNPLLAKTLDMKDHVVDATLRVAAAIENIPGWIADRIAAPHANAAPQADSQEPAGAKLATL
jgi:hypothetical protein